MNDWYADTVQYFLSLGCSFSEAEEKAQERWAGEIDFETRQRLLAKRRKNALARLETLATYKPVVIFADDSRVFSHLENYIVVSDRSDGGSREVLGLPKSILTDPEAIVLTENAEVQDFCQYYGIPYIGCGRLEWF